MAAKSTTKWKDVKLTAEARSAVREAVRRHPEAAKHVRSSSEVSKLRKAQLLDLASSLKIDIEGMLETRDYSHLTREEGYPFEGSIEFDMTMVLLNREVMRKVVLRYQYSPEWAYFNPNTGTEAIGHEGWTMSCEIRAEHGPNVRTSMQERGRTVWKHLATTWEKCADITAPGIWSDEMWDDIYELMDKQAREQDALNREQAKVKKA